ncbi:UPF0481 protein [Senna tora]|uniref:UPF0481 protein n=1 Tax=Senna tora TaxID=362788 RepID=A0A834WPU5_9FABA|nr:UPF0481 protein [Senna tora]
MEDEVIIEIKEMIKDNKEEVLSPTYSIYKVPHSIRDLNPEAYAPKAISIGPFHYANNERLKSMETQKHLFFKRFIQEANKHTSLEDLVRFSFQSEPKVRACYSENIPLNKKELVKHFTDLLRFFHLPQPVPARRGSEFVNQVLQHSASELKEGGVKFKAISTSSNKNHPCLLQIKFSRGVLEIPKITVDDETETLFRNLIALEQCLYLDASYICDYAVVMDCLINTSRDVEVLIHGKIIRSCLADTDDVAQLFNGLCKNMSGSMSFNSEYLEIWNKLNGFYDDGCNKMKATLRNDYCRTPWQTAGSIAGIVLIVLSFVQTIFGIIPVVKQ